MAKQINLGIGGVVKTVKGVYAGVGGVVKTVKSGKCGIGGAVKTFFENTIITSVTNRYGSNYTTISATSTMLKITTTSSSRHGYLDIYGDFGGKSVTITGYEGSSATGWFRWYDSSGTELDAVDLDRTNYTFTLDSGTTQITLDVYPSSSGDRYIYFTIFEIDGHNILEEILDVL